MFFFFVGMNGVQIECTVGDVVDAKVDVLVLKYANGYHGADQAVAQRLGLADLRLKAGEHKILSTNGKIASREVLFIGVGRLGSFDYRPISDFAAHSLEILRRERPDITSVGITIHGPGYGLDELASIDSLIKGLTATRSTAASPVELPKQLLKVNIIERRPKLAVRIAEYLGQTKQDSVSDTLGGESFTPAAADSISSSGTYERRLFAAMPFAEHYLDHWEYALQPAAHENGMLIERLDHEYFIGDIVTEITDRISKATAVVALLDENNPNVFLEVGYAWGKSKPAILLLKEGQEAPFDVRSQKLVRYKRLGQLKEALSKELQGLQSNAII